MSRCCRSIGNAILSNSYYVHSTERQNRCRSTAHAHNAWPHTRTHPHARTHTHFTLSCCCWCWRRQRRRHRCWLNLKWTCRRPFLCSFAHSQDIVDSILYSFLLVSSRLISSRRTYILIRIVVHSFCFVWHCLGDYFQFYEHTLSTKNCQ